ncbi:MAG: imelysin family protein [Archangium sp.]
MKNTTRFIALTVASLMLATCGNCGPTQQENVYARPLKNMVTQSIVPGFVRFETEAKGFETDAASFCTAPDETKLATLQARFRTLSLAWNEVVFYRFGPLDDDLIFPAIIFIESMRQRGTDYTETVRDGVTTAISGTTAMDDAFFTALTFNKVGLLALEVLVFEESSSAHAQAPTAIVAEYVAQPRKCEYLRGVAKLLTTRATRVRSGWDTAYADTGKPYAELFQGETLPDGNEPTGTLINGAVQHLEYLKKRKLDGTLDNRLSNTFFENNGKMLEALQQAMSQDGAADDFGLFDLMVQRGQTEAFDIVNGDFTTTRADAAAKSQPQLSVSVGVLEQHFRNSVPDAVGIDLGLNFTDGD